MLKLFWEMNLVKRKYVIKKFLNETPAKNRSMRVKSHLSILFSQWPSEGLFSISMLDIIYCMGTCPGDIISVKINKKTCECFWKHPFQNQ